MPIRLILLTGVLALLGAVGCSLDGSGNDDVELLEVTVGPELVSCVGLVERTCMVVDDEFFYDTIEGFDYEPGYRYRISMERFDAWPDRDEPPPDASRYGYRLVEVLEKVPAQ